MTTETAPAGPTRRIVTFVVHGNPAPQGSKKAFIAGGRAVLVESNKSRHSDWRNDVSAAAAHAAAGLDGPLDGPLALDAVFRFPMPMSRPKGVRLLGANRKTTAPDLDKLLRALCDSLTVAGLIRDDARITVMHASKIEVLDQWTGVSVTVREIDPDSISSSPSWLG